jgi:hypothetical protein
LPENAKVSMKRTGRYDGPAVVEQAASTGPRPVWKWLAIVVASAAAAYGLTAYVIAPRVWSRYEHRHPWLADAPDVTHIKDGHPGDPLNVALIGAEDEVQEIMQAAGWYPANPLGIESDLRIAADTVLERPYDEAPVSNLYLYGRKEDLAFEQPVGDDPRRRHHVRFWRIEKPDQDGRPSRERPVWIGAVTYDARVGLSHTTGQITHHISPDVDAERDRLFSQLQQTGRLASFEPIDNFHKNLQGKNGGGDPWRTDGRLFVGDIKSTAQE